MALAHPRLPLLLLAVLGAVLLGSSIAGAQEPSPVDLELTMANRHTVETGTEAVFVLSVRNPSAVTVRDITVRFEVDDSLSRTVILEENFAFFGDVNDGVLDFDTNTWTIPQLRGGRTATTKLAADVFNAGTTGNSLVRLQASILASTPGEAPGALGNSRARQHVLWEVDTTNYVYQWTSLSPSLSYGVDAGPGADTFTVRVVNPADNPYPDWYEHFVDQYQLRIKITPTDGLQYTATPAAGTTFNAAQGLWTVGTLGDGGNRQLNIRVTGRGPGPAAEQCLTVEIERVIPEPETPWLPVTACLEHTALITEGLVGLFHWHDCVTGSAYPCDGQPSLELTAVKSAHGLAPASPTDTHAIADVHRGRFRSDDFTYALNQYSEYVLTNDMILQPEDVVVQVPDNAVTRTTEAGSPVWATTGRFVTYTDQTEFGYAWSGYKESVTVSGVGGAAAPGRWRMGSPGQEILDAPDGTKVEGTPYEYDDIPFGDQTVFRIAFEALGTYVVLYEIEATNAGTTYTDSATYTFHVGPVAELAVRDDPASSLAPPGQRAYTIVARNHGPDTAPAVRVTLTGVPEDAQAIVSRGSYTAGTCQDGLCDGRWTIGELRDGASSPSEGHAAAEVLTLIPGAGADRTAEITATVANTQDYRVTIAGTPHTTNYYDYLAHNNTATIAARPGTGAGRVGAPVVRVVQTPVANILLWQPVERLNGHAVTHYEVQRAASPWTTADDVGGTVYADMNLPPGQLMQYRVRAVNSFGVGGPWSSPTLTGPDAPAEFTAEQLQGGDVLLTWVTPDGNGADIAGYTLQVSTNDGRSWGNTGARLGAGDTSWTRRNLSVGPVRLYRIRARTANGPGPWAQAISATIPAPSGLIADYDGASEIALSWTMPDGNAVPVQSYELEHSPDGVNWSRLATVRAADGMSYVHRGRSPGATGHYRVRASTALGHSPWSETAAATTAAGVPGSFRAQANGASEIVLTWTTPSWSARPGAWSGALRPRSMPRTARPTGTRACRPAAPGPTGYGRSASPAGTCSRGTGRGRSAPAPTPAGRPTSRRA